jgi:sugar-specific transcriptional regulator TrmB
MITITKKEKVVLNQINYLQMEYTGGISDNMLKMDLDLTEHQYKEVLEDLERKNLISRIDGKIKALDNIKKISVVDTRKEVRTAELDQIELEALKIIRSLSDDDQLVSRYILEGNLLYGDLKVSNFRMYHILISLENKGIIKKIDKNDGEYYKVTVAI